MKRLEFLRTSIKPLFRTVSQTDFKAMRFQKDLLETSLAKLADEKEKFETLKDNLIEQIGELPLSVNIVAKEEILIKQAQTNNYWAKATDDTFDELAEKLSPLMKYRDTGGGDGFGPAQFDFTDTLKTKEMVEFGPEHSAVSVSKYREMVEKLIMELNCRVTRFYKKSKREKRLPKKKPVNLLRCCMMSIRISPKIYLKMFIKTEKQSLFSLLSIF